MNTFIWLLILGVLLHVARRGWMSYQVRPAVIRTFNLESAADIKVNEAHFLCGRDPIRTALLSTFTIRFYHISWKTAEGTEKALYLEIHFHRISGTLRTIKVMDVTRADEAGFDDVS